MDTIKEKVLVVEDDDDTRYILERLLQKNDFDVKTAPNGNDALNLLGTFNPKVILADWTMPQMDGLEFCNMVKGQDKFKSIYFILLTARVSLKDRIAGLDIGADDFLVKPIENQELIARIKSGIRVYNLQDEFKDIEHNKALLEMACTIGHQINNPLSSLMLSLTNVKNDIDKKTMERLGDDFYLMDRSIARIKEFIDTLIRMQNPEIISYANDGKMLKIKKQ